MKKLAFFYIVLFLFHDAHASYQADLNTVLQRTYIACAGIDDNLHELKVLVGINTAVTGVGTGLGVGAVATGIAKSKTDGDIEGFEKKIRDLANGYQAPDPTEEEQEAFIKEYRQKYGSSNKNDFIVDDEQGLRKQIEQLTQKSKNLGNWRTGLLAGNTVTNVAGAIISSQTINKDDIQGQITRCIYATKDLNDAIIVAKINGVDVSEAQTIYDACREYEFVNLDSINKRGKGAMISASVGAGVGGVGTIISGVANSDKIREDDSVSGKQKEQNLNTASNVLAVGATVASATATVFNATQIAAIKKVAKVSEACTGVLK